MFSMARDVIPYRRSRLNSSTIRASMLVKSYENEELRTELAGPASERESEILEEMAGAEDYRYWADRKEESIENNNGCISDDDKSHKNDTEWSFVDQDGRRAFGREPKATSAKKTFTSDGEGARPDGVCLPHSFRRS